MASMQEHLERLLTERTKPADTDYGRSIVECQDVPINVSDYERSEKQKAYDAHISRTIGQQLNERIAALQEQLNKACELRATVIHLGLADMKVETMRQLIY